MKLIKTLEDFAEHLAAETVRVFSPGTSIDKRDRFYSYTPYHCYVRDCSGVISADMRFLYRGYEATISTKSRSVTARFGKEEVVIPLPESIAQAIVETVEELHDGEKCYQRLMAKQAAARERAMAQGIA